MLLFDLCFLETTGNEVPSKEVLLHLIDYMLTKQSVDEQVDYIMRNMRTHLLVSLDPDGSETAVENDCVSTTGRMNAAGFDLSITQRYAR